MSKLEDLKSSSIVKGLLNNESAIIVNVKWHGNSAVEVTYKDTRGRLNNQLLFRDSESTIEILTNGLPWSFDTDGNLLRLVSEAYRIKLAHLFDPYLAVHTSLIDPLPHQISAVYGVMLERQPLRFLLADDPGAGKTIMTGLLIKELIIRGDLKKCLIVCPGNLVEQWQDELYRKFNIYFEIITNEKLESSASGNVFSEINLGIVRLDKLSRNEDLQEKLRSTDCDLIVCDEAHKMSASLFGGEAKYTKRYRLGKLLSNITRHFLLLTATPHNGKDEDFQLFMALIDPDRFEGKLRTSQQSIDVSDVMRRLVKEELLKFDGTPLFPERIAYTVNYDLSPLEAKLYAAVTEYVQEEFNRADNLNNDGRKRTVGFALTILQRRLASSPEAIYQSLRRRRERLENRVEEETLTKKAIEYPLIGYPDMSEEDIDDLDEAPGYEVEDTEENIVDLATAASTISELQSEIRMLKELENMANKIRTSGHDRKWDELSGLLQDDSHMFDNGGSREKLIIFTEHKDTLYYLVQKICSLMGNSDAVVTIHGSMLRDERRKAEERFKQDKEVRILVATDAAGEGINLQRAHLMINYDMPWNPNRLEQRFGRIHRIGQTEVCHLWNLVSRETREGMVFQRLFQKLEEERQALGGKVFDILGRVSFDNKPLRDLLVDAIRYGNRADVRAHLNEVVDKSLDRDYLIKLIKERAMSADIMDVNKVMQIREDMERIEARRLQPHFIEEFFIGAFNKAGGTIKQRESKRYEITSVPFAIRNRDMQIGFGQPVLPKYERICFEKEKVHVPGLPEAAMICPGHPLLEATLDLIMERNADMLKRGATLIDPNDTSKNIRVLFYIEDAIQDGQLVADGRRRVVSKNIHFVEINENEAATNAGYAPYLDYRSVQDNEKDAVTKIFSQSEWLKTDLENMATSYAIEQIIPAHFSEVKENRLKQIERVIKAVKERLTTEIQYWDYRSSELKRQESAGKVNAKLNSDLAARRAEELSARLRKRITELDLEKQISPLPPVVVGGALIIPIGCLNSEMNSASDQIFGQDRQIIEAKAMDAIIEIENHLGYTPTDVSMKKCGYDIESTVPKSKMAAEGCLRFIEVKGRMKGSTTVTVTKNEILTALNKPDEFILAIVEVDGDNTYPLYLKHPFKYAPDFAAVGVNYSIAELKQTGEMIPLPTQTKF